MILGVLARRLAERPCDDKPDYVDSVKGRNIGKGRNVSTSADDSSRVRLLPNYNQAFVDRARIGHTPR